jgi:hypothetical protein
MIGLRRRRIYPSVVHPDTRRARGLAMRYSLATLISDSRIRCFEFPASFEEVPYPGSELFGAVMLGSAPDLGKVASIKFVLVILHGETLRKIQH